MCGGPASHWFVQAGAATAIATARLGRAGQDGRGSGDVLPVALVAVLLVVTEAPLATGRPANLRMETEWAQLVALGARKQVRHSAVRTGVLRAGDHFTQTFADVSNSNALQNQHSHLAISALHCM